jgi:hypothetical protein
MAKLSREQYREQMAAKVAAAQEVLAAEVAGLVSGEDWRRYLDFAARLHAYSPNNVMLIHAQHAQAFEEGRVPTPDPTYVAGYRTWQALGRQVERGQHGYTVLAPLRATRREAHDPKGNVRVLGRRDTPAADETVTAAPVLRGFTVEHVFDVSQTAGNPLPEAPAPKLLEGEAPPGLGQAVLDMIEARGWKVSTVPDATWLGGANGRTYFGGRFIDIRADMDDAAMVKTLIHEAAHVLLHAHGLDGFTLPRGLQEVEAESVAYVVAAVHGMPTDGYSFPYVAGWAGDQPAEAIRRTQARVADAAGQIIAVSPAAHETGGKVPGAELAVETARQQRLAAQGVTANSAGLDPEPAGMGGPEVA